MNFCRKIANIALEHGYPSLLMQKISPLPLILVVLLLITLWGCYPAETNYSQAQDTTPAQKEEVLFGYPIGDLMVVEGVIERDENLSDILTRYQVPMTRIAELANVPDTVFNPRKIKMGRPYTLFCEKDSALHARCFIYQPNNVDYVTLEFGDSLRVFSGSRSVDTLSHSLSGVIESSLYQSVIDAGGSPVLVNALADVYAWEIDFFGLQTGDTYTIYYTTYAVNGEPAGFGEVLCASFRHMGHEFLAFRFDQGNGHGPEYFDEEGNSLRKTFLKAPLSFTRISSRFSYSRLHPILKIRRPHLGVDYAAPTGTPVLAVGDGVITKAGWGGGGGKTVKIRHNSNYQTAYLHLSRYGKNIRIGTVVTQGQVIGYVGSTGLSTGPHLDFRFYKNGTPVDPLKIDAPSADPITKENFLAYSQERSRLQMVMDDIHKLEQSRDWLAMKKESPL